MVRERVRRVAAALAIAPVTVPEPDPETVLVVIALEAVPVVIAPAAESGFLNRLPPPRALACCSPDAYLPAR